MTQSIATPTLAEKIDKLSQPQRAELAEKLGIGSAATNTPILKLQDTILRTLSSPADNPKSLSDLAKATQAVVAIITSFSDETAKSTVVA